MPDLEQQAIDYTLGLLAQEESTVFESLLESVPEARVAYARAQDELSLVALSSSPTNPSPDFRGRVLETSSVAPATPNLPFLDNLPAISPQEERRYHGGGGSVDLTDLKQLDYKDQVNRLYEGLLGLTPLVAGDASASNGNLTELRQGLNSLALDFPEHQAFTSNGISQSSHEAPAQSLLRSYLTSLPSMGFFTERILLGKGTIGDVRRLFYLCRDQKKIMRASFGDLDASRLADDETLRLHGAGLLRTKWWGAEHTYFSEPGKARCGHFFDGPVTERCVEFAEYDSNLYCLANLIAARSSDGEFKIELFKDLTPHCVVALVSSFTTEGNHAALQSFFAPKEHSSDKRKEEGYLASLVMTSVARAHRKATPRDAIDAKLMGCDRSDGQTFLWFAWPEIPESEETN
jgi:hypothetical protein